MEHREPPRIARSEGSQRDATEPFPTRDFPHFVPPANVRRLAFSKIGRSLLALGLVLVAGYGFVQYSSAWLHRQPEYRLDLESIDLAASEPGDSPLPPGYRGGKLEFLRRAGILEEGAGSKSVLELDFGQLTRRLRQSCWVKRVVRVQNPHWNHLIITLELRKPVARVSLSASKLVVLDADAHLLPREEIDLDATGPLIEILSFDGAPQDPKPGTPWKKKGPEQGVAVPDERMADAARLAGFLKGLKEQGDDLVSGPQTVAVYPQTNDRRLTAGIGQGLWIVWGESPGKESAGQPSAQEKWRRVRGWMAQHGAAGLHPCYYLEFTKTDIRYVLGKCDH